MSKRAANEAVISKMSLITHYTLVISQSNYIINNTVTTTQQQKQFTLAGTALSKVPETTPNHPNPRDSI